MIFVKDLKKIGQGTVKTVYQHHYDQDKVIKIIRPELVGKDGGFKKHGSLKRKMYQGVYRQYRREFIQYLQLCKNSYGSGKFIFPVETPYGLVQTDQGLGFVAEKIVAPDGKGWTVEDLVRGPGLQDKHRQALDRFFQECIDLHIVFGEVNYAGIMYTESRRGYPEFVLVDGVGEKLLIPVRAMSKRISARYVKKIQQRIYAQIAEIERSQQPT